MQKTIELYKITRNEKDCLLWRYGAGGEIEIYDIAVYSERRKGVGREMVNELSKATLYAFCRADNAIACRFYESLGFVGSLLENFYTEGNAMIYVKTS
jgi:ribosomal protein S18 acetylase RimI-like enzyme